jgi:hypothetical protein
MRALAKVGLVGAGYVGAVVVAVTVVTLYIAATSGPDRQTYAAMYDFGDSILFMVVLGLAAVVPSATALFFLRPYEWFWAAFSMAAIVVAATAVAAFVDYVAVRSDILAVAGIWSAMTVPRILVAPVFALAFLVSAVIAPSRRPRRALLAATAMEVVAFACVVVTWLPPFQPR